ncbi:(d)CMP kinase [Savagea sp. SN6]|uniref:Cytidylate kinase n=1 Tax=Savagea serpentis TaxID=2785297 RepID=A0A8J7KS05_9BACL|nr:(d)CMP kinase [Savagea serpentis]MBF4500064.1 (d)CMP kinase [Savagea serpentis]
MTERISIAIDGPAAAGKSTIAKIVAESLGYAYIDTGAMYRALTWKAQQQQIDVTDEALLADLLRSITIELKPSPKGQLVYVDGEEVTDVIRTSEVTNAVSQVATHESVRERMVELQRTIGEAGAVVMDGRDIGTAVLPFAQLKIFMTASVEERAERRYAENKSRGIETPLDELKKEIRKRDQLDTEREHSPLVQAEDALLIDTTGRTIEEVAREIEQLAKERITK